MTWPRTGCYTATSSQLRHSNDRTSTTTVLTSNDAVTLTTASEDTSYPRTEESSYYSCATTPAPPSATRCPLHKYIRNKAWQNVSTYIQKNPQDIGKLNRMGWSSLVLAVYHDAPVSIVAEMLSYLGKKEKQVLLSTPVPNGARLCLHFCARFCSELETFRLLVEAYPLALVVPSADGNRPLDRAIYYHKDTQILRYLEEATKKQMTFIDNIKLRRVILDACALQWNRRIIIRMRMTRMVQTNDEEKSKKKMQELESIDDDKTKFVLGIYGYAKEREMIGMFWEILSYVGIPAGRQERHIGLS